MRTVLARRERSRRTYHVRSGLRVFLLLHLSGTRTDGLPVGRPDSVHHDVLPHASDPRAITYWMVFHYDEFHSIMIAKRPMGASTHYGTYDASPRDLCVAQGWPGTLTAAVPGLGTRTRTTRTALGAVLVPHQQRTTALILVL